MDNPLHIIIYAVTKQTIPFTIMKEILCFEVISIRLLKESDTRFSTSSIFHKSVSPGPLSIRSGPFRIIP